MARRSKTTPKKTGVEGNHQGFFESLIRPTVNPQAPGTKKSRGSEYGWWDGKVPGYDK